VQAISSALVMLATASLVVPLIMSSLSSWTDLDNSLPAAEVPITAIEVLHG
jgi:hypothetical protein